MSDDQTGCLNSTKSNKVDREDDSVDWNKEKAGEDISHDIPVSEKEGDSKEKGEKEEKKDETISEKDKKKKEEEEEKKK